MPDLLRSRVALGLSLGVIVLFGAFVLFVRLVPQVKLANPEPSTSQTQPLSSEEIQRLVERIDRLQSVSLDEVPSVGYVSDVNAVKQMNPVLFERAEVGDWVLLWSDRAVVYSEAKDEVVGSLRKDDVEAIVKSIDQERLKQVRIEVRNGSGKAGRARQVADRLLAIGFSGVMIGDAATSTAYPQTVLFSDATVDDQALELIRQAVEFKTVPSLPGEARLRGNVVIVLGKNTP